MELETNYDRGRQLGWRDDLASYPLWGQSLQEVTFVILDYSGKNVLKVKILAPQTLPMYAHLSNKRGNMLIDFLDFFHPPLLVYCSYVLVFSKKSHPPRLLILQLLHPLHVYSNLHGY